MKLEHKVPILIPCFNNLEYTQKAVASLLKNTDKGVFECLLIDNGSTDDTPQWLSWLVKEHPGNFRALRLEKNLGFGGGLNCGLEAISGLPWEFAVIANNDLLFTPGWLDGLLSSYEQASAKIPRLGVVGPVSNFAGGSQGIEVSYKSVEELDGFAQKHRAANAGRWHEAGVVVGLLMLFPRAFLESVGLFDERFFPGTWEENDWELRGAIKGWRYAVDSATFIHHYGSKTLATIEDSKDQRKNFVVNRDRFRDKWSAPDGPWEELAAERYKLRGMDPEAHRMPDGRLRKWVVGACRVKNGAKWMRRVLERESEFADEIVILVDQATTDNTAEICAEFPKVVAIEKEPPHEYNEAWSRNRVLQMAFDRNPDWIQCFDCDEIWEKRAVERRQELTDPVDPTVMLWVQPIIQLWNSEHTQRADGVWGGFYQGRMFRVVPGQRIDNANNLIHSGSTPFVPQDRHGFSYIRIAHHGNIEPEVRTAKYDWYTKTDTDKDLDMALGHWKDYYWRLYYGQPTPQDQQQPFDGRWSVIKDDADWTRPPYGKFHARDVYRHVRDEAGMVLVPYDEAHVVSLCMLVHNEAGMLPNAVSSVRSFIGELIVIDTGSVDGSDHVAERLGAKVFRFDWKDDFSAARNFSLSKATGDWILRIDPDEIVPWETACKIPMLVRDRMEGYVFPIVNWLEDPASKRDPKWAPSETCRLFRNQYPTVRFNNPVHEELDDSLKALSERRAADLEAAGMPHDEAKERGKVLVAKVPFRIYHYGYLRGREFCERKFGYYYTLGRRHMADRPDDPRPYFNTAVHEMHVGRYEDAIKNYMRCLELDPKNHMALNDEGVLLMAVLGDLAGAERCFRKALEAMNGQTLGEHRTRVEQNLQEVKLRLLSRMLAV